MMWLALAKAGGGGVLVLADYAPLKGRGDSSRLKFWHARVVELRRLRAERRYSD